MAGIVDVCALSDKLGVSSALYLGAHDIHKLLTMIDDATDYMQAEPVLRRLSMVHLTLALDRATSMVASVSLYQEDEALQMAVRAGHVEAASVLQLCTHIVATWESQLAEERRQRQPPPQPDGKPGPKPRFRDPACSACKGAHRKHTCIALAQK